MISLGSVIFIAVKPIFKIYLIIGVGFMLARKKILTVDTTRNLSTMTVLVLLPCLVFNKIVTNIDNSDLKQIGTIAIVFTVMTVVGAIGTFLIGILCGCPKEWYGGLLACGTLPNISDLPIAYVQSMEDTDVFADIDKGVSYICIYLMFQAIVQFNLGTFKLVEFDFRDEIAAAAAAASAESKDQHSDPSPTGSSTAASEKEVERPSPDSLQPPPSLHQSLASSEAISDVSSLSSESTSHTTHTRRPSQLYRTASAVSRGMSRTATALARHNTITESIMSDERRARPSEDMEDIVRVYSRFSEVRRRRLQQQQDEALLPVAISTTPTPLTADQRAGLSRYERFRYDMHRVHRKLRHVQWGRVIKNSLKEVLMATFQPVSIAIIISIIVCMIPWVKALFVITTQATLPAAPDGQPPLSFVMDFATYIGAAQVPIGLLLLGGTIGRLSFGSITRRTWFTPMGVCLWKLFIMPVIGASLNAALARDGLMYDDDLLYFISNINFCLPPATSLIYLTAFYTPVGSTQHVQMDCLALIYICHYICLVVCLPFDTSYTIKKALHY